MSGLRWIPLGTNGFFPSHGRQTMSFLVEAEDRLLLLDAGTGVARLGEAAITALIRQHEELDVLLTHYHLDHIVGLASLFAVWGRRVTVWAPGEPLVDAEGPEELGRLIRPPFFPKRLTEMGQPVTLRSYRESELDIGPLHLRLRRQRHPGGSVGVRLDDRFAYVTDTEEDEATVPFVAGVDTLLHEVWFLERETRERNFRPRGHSSTTGVAEIAARADVGLLVPVHHHPMRDAAEIDEVVDELAAAGSREVLLAREAEVFEA